ncbi:MAG: hypothetical protein J6J38_04285 [Lachnospiraceae bacterium]|nr:hypothetical protein [Lachnospiraceae bacterium]
MVGSTAFVGSGVSVGARVAVGSGALVSARVAVGSGVFVSETVAVGSGALVGSTVTVGSVACVTFPVKSAGSPVSFPHPANKTAMISPVTNALFLITFFSPFPALL